MVQIYLNILAWSLFEGNAIDMGWFAFKLKE